jgi:hypothetical protein
MWRRVGDYREWEVGYVRGSGGEGGYELWSGLDVRSLDLGLVEDKLEKCLRECENKYLLLDNRAKRVALAVPSDLPRPLLSLMLRRLFEGLQAQSVTLLPSSTMACVGTGVRSGIVLDLGWFETSCVAVSEYREVRSARSVKAGKMMVREMRKVFKREINEQGSDEKTKLGFEEAEEIMCRMAWCRSKDTPLTAEQQSTRITLPSLSTTANKPAQISSAALSEPAERVLLTTDTSADRPDDHDTPIPQLLYSTLLALPIDIRNTCLNHIIFTGGLANIPGLKARILAEVQELVDTNGWNPVRAYAPRVGLQRPVRTPLSTIHADRRQPPPSSAIKTTEDTTQPPLVDEGILLPPHLQPHDTNPIDTKLASLALNAASPTPPAGTLRAVNTLGAWAGASLVSNLRIKGVVEIERERFMSHGLVGGAVPGSIKPGVVEGNQSYAKSRQSFGPGVKLDKNQGWNLGVWA